MSLGAKTTTTGPPAPGAADGRGVADPADVAGCSAG